VDHPNTLSFFRINDDRPFLFIVWFIMINFNLFRALWIRIVVNQFILLGLAIVGFLNEEMALLCLSSWIWRAMRLCLLFTPSFVTLLALAASEWEIDTRFFNLVKPFAKCLIPAYPWLRRTRWIWNLTSITLSNSLQPISGCRFSLVLFLSYKRDLIEILALRVLRYPKRVSTPGIKCPHVTNIRFLDRI